jgi:hypothetical protein
MKIVKKNKKPNIKKYLVLVFLPYLMLVSQKTHAENISHETYSGESIVKVDYQKDKENQIKYIKKIIAEIKEQIYILLKEKPEKLTNKEEQIVNIFEEEFKKNNKELLEKYRIPIKNLKQYSEFRNELLKNKKSFLDFDLRKMEITFFKDGKNIGTEIISGKGRPGS